MGSISTRVWQYIFAVLDRLGKAARVVSTELPGSFRSTKHCQWCLVLCPIFYFLGRQFYHQLQVDRRWIFRKCWIRCDGGQQRSTLHHVRQRQRRVYGQLCRLLRWRILVWLLCSGAHNNVNNKRFVLLEGRHILAVLECRRSSYGVLGTHPGGYLFHTIPIVSYYVLVLER